MKINGLEKTIYIFIIGLVILMVGVGFFLYRDLGGIEPIFFSTHDDSQLIYTVPTTDRSFTFHLEGGEYKYLTITKRDGKIVSFDLSTLSKGFIM
jgi:hypothetical protein